MKFTAGAQHAAPFLLLDCGDNKQHSIDGFQTRPFYSASFIGRFTTRPYSIISLIINYPNIVFRSSSTVETGAILNFSTRMLSAAGVTNAGRLGPRRMFLMPR